MQSLASGGGIAHGQLVLENARGNERTARSSLKTEDEFERTVFETSELLEDIFLLRRQVRGGSKTGIPDIIGVDGEGNVCIIELKNTEVDAAIIPIEMGKTRMSDVLRIFEFAYHKVAGSAEK